MTSFTKRAIAFAVLTSHLNVIAGSHLPTEPSGVFEIGKIQVGVTTLADAKAALGNSAEARQGQSDESPIQICYLIDSANGRYYIIFGSGAMGGFTRITEFSLTRDAPKQACTSVRSRNKLMATGNGVTLGQSRDEFYGKFLFKFKETGDISSYRENTTRIPNTEELSELRRAWPAEKTYQFDVSVSIDAVFKNGHLVKYRVSKIESF
jgi:hypothetical protein